MPRLSYYTSDATTAEYAAAIKDPKVSMTLEYFNIDAYGALPRDILAYSGIPWKGVVHEVAETLPETIDAPCKCLPFLRIHREGSPEVIISESLVIDMYLAEKAGLLGDNEWEAQVIKSLYSNAYWARDYWWVWILVRPKAEERSETVSRYIEGKLKKWIENVEFHHAQNAQRHSQGYLFGNKLSLADLMVTQVLYTIENQPHDWVQPVLETLRKSAAITKIRQLVDNEPRLQTWRSSPEAERLKKKTAEVNKRIVANAP